VGSLRGEISNFPFCLYCFCLKGQKWNAILPWAKSVTSFLPTLALKDCFAAAATAGSSDRAPRLLILARSLQDLKEIGQEVAALHAQKRPGPPPAHSRSPELAHPLARSLPVALPNLGVLFFSSVLLNEESHTPHFNYTRVPFIIPPDLFEELRSMVLVTKPIILV
jgi:hypothetical protein